MPTFSAEPCFSLPKPQKARVYAHQGGVLLLAGLTGEPAYWSADGLTFAEAAVEGPGASVALEPVNEHQGDGSVNGDGSAFFFDRGSAQLWRASIGPKPTFSVTGFKSPAEYKFRLRDVVIDASGVWWAGGESSSDDLIGQVFCSPDGARWALVAPALKGSVSRFVRTADALCAVHYKFVSAVRPEGVATMFTLKDHVANVAFSPTLTLCIGRDWAGVLATGAKQEKYGAVPTGDGREARVLALDEGLLLGGANGLFASNDALTWSPVAGFRGAVAAVVMAAAGPVAVNTKGDVFTVRGK